MIKPSEAEQNIGLTTFFTSYPGIGGILRYRPEDFIVNELSKEFPISQNGRFLLVKITAKNWETNDLIRKLAKTLHISNKRISFAGTKDKRAITSQIISFYKVNTDQINQISIQDVECDVLQHTNKHLSIGDLIGNSFKIVIRDVSSKIQEKNIQEIIKPLQSIGGFPNFFGVQRFGGIRPITHKVGKAMVEADFEKAVMIYLCETSMFEGDDATVARKELWETRDFKQGFHQFPKRLLFEKQIMQHLTNEPEDYAGALQKLPKNLLTMLVYAYQSYLFNRMLSNRMSGGLSLTEAVEGDYILPLTKDKIVIDPIPVSRMNVNKVNQQIKKGKAVVSCVIPGSETIYATGEMGEIQRKVIEDEKVDIRNFIIPEIPAASSYGTHRSVVAKMNDATFSIKRDEFHPERKKVIISFALFKGSYATSLLREIMKLEDITKY
jgi:tRNA pseudouridine13 synthase